MEKEELRLKVKEVVAKVLKIDQSEIDDDANFIFDLGADSMQSMQLVAALDEEFNIEMGEEEAAAMQTISEAVDFIEGLIN